MLSRKELVGMCLATGATLSFMFAVNTSSLIYKAEIAQDGTNPAVMRVYKSGKDAILVQNPTNNLSYMPLASYLRTVDPSKRQAEEVRIQGLQQTEKAWMVLD